MPESTAATSATQNISRASNNEAFQSKKTTPGVHQITGTGQSPAKSFIEQEADLVRAEADLVRAQIHEMEAFLIKFSGEWREAEVKVYDELLTKGKITRKKQGELYRNADSRSAKAKTEALNVANKAAKEPNISSKFTELKEFVKYEIISPQDSYRSFLNQLVQAGIITKESPELFSRAGNGKSVAQETSTPAITPSTPLLSKDNLLSLTSDLRKGLEPSK